VRTTVGALDPPLGNTRLQVAKLIAALLATNSSDVNKELANLGTTDVLLVRFLLYFTCSHKSLIIFCYLRYVHCLRIWPGNIVMVSLSAI
jgi:hypothetical protein